VLFALTLIVRMAGRACVIKQGQRVTFCIY
jgi:hypothetical protein